MDVCRICLSQDYNGEFISLLDNRAFVNKITFICAAVKIELTDHLPKKLCGKCAVKLDDACDLKATIERSEHVLRNNVDAFEVPVKVETADTTAGDEPLCEVKIEHVSSCQSIPTPDVLKYFDDGDDDSDYRSKTKVKAKKQRKKKMRKKIKVEDVEKRRKFPKIKSEFDEKPSKHKSMYICEVCGAQVAELRHHMQSAHLNVRVTCKECPKTFKSRKSLMLHVNNTHVAADMRKQYPCKLCPSTNPLVFLSATSLRRHRYRDHSDDWSFKCSACPKTFYYKQYLMQHLRVHSGEAPFQCEFCCRTFTKRWNLTQHLRIHTSETPYKCAHCKAAYRHNVSLKSHMSKVHHVDIK